MSRCEQHGTIRNANGACFWCDVKEGTIVTPEGLKEPIKCSCDPEYRHLCWKCGGTGYLQQ